MLSLEALADPTRRRIVEMLAERDRAVGEIVEAFRMSAPAISQHLKILREAGLVTSRVAAQSRIQSLNPAGLQDMSAWLAGTLGLWSRRLDGLEQALLAEDAAAAAPATASATSRAARKTPKGKSTQSKKRTR